MQAKGQSESPLLKYRAILLQKTLNSHLAAQLHNQTAVSFFFSCQQYKFTQLAERSQLLSEGKLAANFQTRSGAQGN
jgi:hypothetical protein